MNTAQKIKQYYEELLNVIYENNFIAAVFVSRLRNSRVLLRIYLACAL